jgi:flavin reductase (DIM6/NTAB) family NADH-FMN oxidoreductase RutF
MFAWDFIFDQGTSAVDTRQLRRALGSYPTGVCLVTTVGTDGKREGMTINSFASVSLSPPLVLWSVRDDARSAQAFFDARGFVINVLGAVHLDMALHFSRPAPDKFVAHEDRFHEGLWGCPALSDAIATYECTTYSRHQEGDHTILIGRVDKFSHCDGPPLMFHAGQLGSLQELAAQKR